MFLNMENSKPKAAAADASFRAPQTVEGRSALILAKIALQTLADLHPEAASSIDEALRHQIEVARADERIRSVKLAALLQDVRAHLQSEEKHVSADEDVWYIE